MDKYTFSAEEHTKGHWLPIGRNKSGDEIWRDGCCIENKLLAERIASNMERAYNVGFEQACVELSDNALNLAKNFN